MDEACCDSDEDGVIGGRPLAWRPFVGYGLAFVGNVFASADIFAKALATEFFAAQNHEINQLDFHREATAELEGLMAYVPGDDAEEDDDYEEDE